MTNASSRQRQSPIGWIVIALVVGMALAGAWIGIVLATAPANAEVGVASWYGPGFCGHRTASGERFNCGAMTAAHKHLPFGSRVRVVNLATGRSIVVRINDRGPFVRSRCIDLSPAARRALGMGGTARVRIDVLK
jgi:rare lipoprotein A